MSKWIIEFLMLLNFSTTILAGLMQRWNFEFVEMSTDSNDRSVVDLDAKIVHLSRGKYGVSGFWNLQTDLYDDTYVLFRVDRSMHREKVDDSKIPLLFFNETLSNAMNKFYKPYAQTELEKCCVNAPIFKETFEAPLTKRNIIANKCVLETDNLPNILMEGYYRLRITVYGAEHVSYFESLFYVENKMF